MKYFFDPFPCLRRRLPLYHILRLESLLLYEILNHLRFNLLLLLLYIAFVTSECYHKSAHVVFLLHFLRPIRNTLKGSLTGKIVTYYCCYGVSVVHAHQWSKPITTACVPNMQLHYGAIYVDILLHVSSADGDVVIFWKCVSTVPLCNRGFAHTGVT